MKNRLAETGAENKFLDHDEEPVEGHEENSNDRKHAGMS